MPEQRNERNAVEEALHKNWQRRNRARAELDDARAELRDLLVRGQAASFDVAKMARTAQISRDTAHRLLREKGGSGA